MNENLRDKFISRHGNASFLFIVSKVIEKESDTVISNVCNLVFRNGRACEIPPKVPDNAPCAADVTVTDIEEESFVLPVKFCSSIPGLFSNFTVMIFVILNNF